MVLQQKGLSDNFLRFSIKQDKYYGMYFKLFHTHITLF